MFLRKGNKIKKFDHALVKILNIHVVLPLYTSEIQKLDNNGLDPLELAGLIYKGYCIWKKVNAD